MCVLFQEQLEQRISLPRNLSKRSSSFCSSTFRSISVVLARDNDPKHRSNYSRTWKSDHQIVTLPWPSLSPDINPVENLWSFLKVKVAQRRPKTLEDLVNAIKNEWNELPSELAYNLMNSMENRVQSVIDSGGDYIL